MDKKSILKEVRKTKKLVRKLERDNFRPWFAIPLIFILPVLALFIFSKNENSKLFLLILSTLFLFVSISMFVIKEAIESHHSKRN